MNWDLFTKEEDDAHTPNPPTVSSFLPTALREEWGDNDTGMFPYQQAGSFARAGATRPNVVFGANSYTQPAQVLPGSAPMSNNMFDSSDVTFQGVIEFEGAAQSSKSFYQVQFNQVHQDLYQANRNINLNQGDYVLTEADRGYDIGRIGAVIKRPPVREAQNAKKIIRPATQHEIAQLPQKAVREARALMMCRAKVQEFQLPMVITAAEFQFDGNKLTFYYQATSYIDFRNLVKALFRIFQIRIWMQTSPTC